jgi:ADP-ribosylglycohydrolase
MRLAPIPMYFAKEPRLAVEMSGQSSRTTHGSVLAIDACRYLGSLITGALESKTKQVLLSKEWIERSGYFVGHKQQLLCNEITMISQGSFKQNCPSLSIKATGFVVDSLEAAIWAFHHSTNFEDGCLLAVNLGNDADTTGAVYGQLAGAYYGEESIPKRWLEKLAKRELIASFAADILMKAQNR